MSIYEDLKCGKEKLSLVGLGYVGMPIAVEFAKHGIGVIGYDLNSSKIAMYKKGIDPTNEVGNEIIKNTLKPISCSAIFHKNEFSLSPIHINFVCSFSTNSCFF